MSDKPRKGAPWWLVAALAVGNGGQAVVPKTLAPNEPVSTEALPEVQKVSGTVDIGHLPALEGKVTVLNFPADQAIHGTVEISNADELQLRSVEVSNLASVQEVAGEVDVSNFPEVQEVSGTVEVDNFPVSTVRLLGFTSNQYPANAGVLGSLVACQIEFGRGRMCTTRDLLQLDQIAPVTGNEVGWINPDTSITSTCNGWTSTSSTAEGLTVSGVGQFKWLPCSSSFSVACCSTTAEEKRE